MNLYWKDNQNKKVTFGRSSTLNHYNTNAIVKLISVVSSRLMHTLLPVAVDGQQIQWEVTCHHRGVIPLPP